MNYLEKKLAEFDEKWNGEWALTGTLTCYDERTQEDCIIPAKQFITSLFTEIVGEERERILAAYDDIPACFCNDGKYSDKEMIECLSNVIKINAQRFRDLINACPDDYIHPQLPTK